MKQLHRKPLFNAVSLAISGSVIAASIVLPAQAAEGTLEEVIVTAQKRVADLQDVAVSIQVLGEEQLRNLQVKGFEDYILFLPTVSFTSNGPGYGQIYMRGISSGGDGVHSGSMPSVGYYLDEQPVTTINQILDVHIYDIDRIETLSGPQGTLYGQGSQAGTIRIISNKPKIGEHESGYDISADSVKSGDLGYGFDGFINIPINDRMAARLVAWYQDAGGWIDNVPGELYYPASGITHTNEAAVENDFNTARVYGLRAQLKIDLNDNWTLTPSINYQDSEATGSWFNNPENVGKLQVLRLFPEWQDEDWMQASLTLEGKVGDLDLVYAGAYLDRDVLSQYDYSGYAEYLEDLYAYYGYYCLYYDPLGDCADPSQYVAGDENFNRKSHELRLSSDTDGRLRWVAGLFYQRQEHLFDLQWVVPDMNPADSVVENGVTTWQTHQQRIDRDKAAFGELYFDFATDWTVTLGARYFEYENSLFGFNGFVGHCTGFYDDNGDFVEDRENGTPQFPCFDTGILDDVSDGDDWAFKGSLEWRFAPDKLVYATWSEGFRAGGVNRARVPGIPKYQPDFVTNYEMGWKTEWANGALRFNGAAYIVDWDDFQYGFLDFTISNLTIVQNVGNAQTKGLEFELTWAATESLLLTAAGSYNDAQLEENFWRSSADRDEGLPPDAPEGTPMPYVPEFQYSLIGRYSFDAGDLPMFAQAAWSWRDGSWNDLEVSNERRRYMDSYGVLNLSTGIEKDNWSLTLYAKNVLDEEGQINIGDPGYYSPSGVDYNQVWIKPFTVGIRWSQQF
jgi:outer membrane receptor protein involved in Fe transport